MPAGQMQEGAGSLLHFLTASDLAASQRSQYRLKLFLVPGKLTNPFGQLFGGHCILIGGPAKLRFSQRLARFAVGTWRQLALQWAVILIQLLQPKACPR
ncbi:hypothetical protein [Pseudomonas sp. 24 E 13]|nr:hypothetical protein [Pseudomonas sp. 24 E 13]